MALVRFNNVRKSFAGADVLGGITFDLAPGTKVGLVGENGSGKSSILRLITGQLQPDSGSVSVARSADTWYVSQIPELHSERTAFEEVLAIRPALATLRKRLRNLERRLQRGGWQDDVRSAEYATAVAEFSEAGGYPLETDARDALLALGLGEARQALPFASLSGGEQARVALAQALLAGPSLLLLDEPNNHLDVQGIRWLEEWLRRFRGTLLIVTHDRELLDRTVDTIFALEDGRLEVIRGRYAEYVKRRQERIERQKAEYLEQQRRVRQLRQAIRSAEQKARGIENRTIHFHYRKRALKVARRAVTLKRRLERLFEGEAAVEKPREERDRIRLQVAPEGWKHGTVLQAAGLSKSYGECELFDDLHLTLGRGERLALVGPNGSGKSTLMKILLGLEEADGGDVWLDRAVTMFYCDQHQGGLKLGRSVYELVESETELSETQIHYLLSRLMLTGTDLRKKVEHLSGGERTRLVLALLMNTGAELLLLDEPTNHLDLPSIEVLEEALRAFPGAVLFASHDRRLIEAVATETLEL